MKTKVGTRTSADEETGEVVAIAGNCNTDAGPSVAGGVLTGPVLKAPGVEEDEETTSANHKMPTNQLWVTLPEKPYACDDCNYVAVTANILKIHKRIHTGEKPYGCDECEYKTSTANSLKVHKRKHTGEKPYACDECEHRAASSSNLSKHKKRIHTGGRRRFACKECDFTAFDRFTLYNHIRRIHIVKKHYACDECDFTVSSASHLKQHKGIHSGEKPYACNFTFRRANNLDQHKRTHTGEIRYASYVSSEGSSVTRRRELMIGLSGVEIETCPMITIEPYLPVELPAELVLSGEVVKTEPSEEVAIKIEPLEDTIKTEPFDDEVAI